MSVELKVGMKLVTIDPSRIADPERFYRLPAGGEEAIVTRVDSCLDVVSIREADGQEHDYSIRPDRDGDSWATFFVVA